MTILRINTYCLAAIVALLVKGSFALRIGYTQSHGCTDPLALNYNAQTERNDGSCVYPGASLSPLNSWLLPPAMVETSGLIIWNNQLWTHNDGHDINLYAFDTLDVFNFETYELTGAVNIDWEEIAQDDDHVYVGDFGNNYNGNRTNLQIIRIEKASLLSREPLIDTIRFSYALQGDLSGTGLNYTDFDCEAFIVSGDSLYLFTKEWVSQRTSLYVLPKEPGNYVARYLDSYDVQGLVTGATYLKDKRLLVLCGYSTFVQPFLYLFYDFQGHDFFGGNKRKMQVNIPLHQVEAITTSDGLFYYLTNEALLTTFVTIDQKLHTFDLTDYLGHYLADDAVDVVEGEAGGLRIYPNPFRDMLVMETTNVPPGTTYRVVDINGREWLAGKTSSEVTRVHLGELTRGIYWLILDASPIIREKIISY